MLTIKSGESKDSFTLGQMAMTCKAVRESADRRAASERMQYRRRVGCRVTARLGLDWLTDWRQAAATAAHTWLLLDPQRTHAHTRLASSSCRASRLIARRSAGNSQRIIGLHWAARRPDERRGLCSWSADHITWHTVVSSHRYWSAPAFRICICILQARPLRI